MLHKTSQSRSKQIILTLWQVYSWKSECIWTTLMSRFNEEQWDEFVFKILQGVSNCALNMRHADVILFFSSRTGLRILSFHCGFLGSVIADEVSVGCCNLRGREGMHSFCIYMGHPCCFWCLVGRFSIPPQILPLHFKWLWIRDFQESERMLHFFKRALNTSLKIFLPIGNLFTSQTLSVPRACCRACKLCKV